MRDLCDAQLDGLACIVCESFDRPMVPVGVGPCGELFACREHADGGRELVRQLLTVSDRANIDVRGWGPIDQCSACLKRGTTTGLFVEADGIGLACAYTELVGLGFDEAREGVADLLNARGRDDWRPRRTFVIQLCGPCATRTRTAVYALEPLLANGIPESVVQRIPTVEGW